MDELRKQKYLKGGIIAFFVIWVLGGFGFAFSDPGAPTDLSNISDWAYRSLQLFGLNYDEPESGRPIHLLLHLARLCAPLLLVIAILSLGMALTRDWSRKWFLLRSGRQWHLILGFGPIGQAIAERLARQRVPFIVVSEEAVEDQREKVAEQGGILIRDDPASATALATVRVASAQTVHVALGDDMANLDAAEQVRDVVMAPQNWFTPPVPRQSPIRVYTESLDVAASLPDAAQAGFLCGQSLALFNLKGDAARHLVLHARWDRQAILLGQDRVHVVIVGCGGQGEAVLQEVLLLCWRAALGPPLVTVVDLEANRVEARLRRRSPHLFDTAFGIPGWIPPRFLPMDVEEIRYDEAEGDHGLKARALRAVVFQDHPPTAWVFACREDTMNLQAGLALQTAMQTRKLPAAPIHIRVWCGHSGPAPSIRSRTVSQTSTFGSLQDALDQTHALRADPDETSKALHASYVKAAQTSDLDEQQSWETLSETMKASNRRVHRHAPMKLEDLGLDWRRTPGEMVFEPPKVLIEGGVPFEEAEARRFAFPARPPSTICREEVLSERFLAAAVIEHNRWVADRSIDGWRNVRQNANGAWENRNDIRRLHHCMVYWDELDPAIANETGKTDDDLAKEVARTRRYDGLLLGALTFGLGKAEAAPENPAAGRFACADLIDLNAEQFASLKPSVPPKESWMVPIPARIEAHLKALGGRPQPNRVTRLLVIMPTGHPIRAEKTRLQLQGAAGSKSPWSGVFAELRKLADDSALCWLTLVFTAPPAPEVLRLAEALADSVARGSVWPPVMVETIWSWEEEGANGPDVSEKIRHSIRTEEEWLHRLRSGHVPTPKVRVVRLGERVSDFLDDPVQSTIKAWGKCMAWWDRRTSAAAASIARSPRLAARLPALKLKPNDDTNS